MNIYEAMYILSPELEEQQIDTEIETIQSDIRDNGGEIISTEKMGKRLLAYSIKKQDEGFYFLVYFKLEGAALGPIKDKYRLNASIIRYMILRIKENQIPQPEPEQELEAAHEE